MNKFVYIIYNVRTMHIFEVYLTEDECVRAFNAKYDEFKNVDWMGCNLSFWLKSNFFTGG